MRRPLRQNQEHRLAFCPTDSYDNKYTFRGFIQVSYPGLAEGKVTQKSFIVIRMTVRTFTQQIAINRIRSSTTLLSYCFSVRKPLVSQTIDPQRNRYQLIGDRADSWHMICTAHEHTDIHVTLASKCIIFKLHYQKMLGHAPKLSSTTVNWFNF